MFAFLVFLPLLGKKHVEAQPYLFCICLFTPVPGGLLLMGAQ